MASGRSSRREPAGEPGGGQGFHGRGHLPARLGLGGQARNWDYAAYELHELEESFERVERAWPRYRTFSITELLGVTKEPMANLDAAIKAKDGARFDAAYRELTQACNTCHHGTNRPMVVIQFPAATAPYPDQDFTPPKP